MSRLRLAAVLATAAFASLAVPSGSALAATEFGSRCTMAGGMPGTHLQTVDPPGETYASPVAGIITRWGTNLAVPTTAPTRIKVVRPGAAPNTWNIVGTQDIVNVIAGNNEFLARIPVNAGDRLAAFSGLAVMFCAPTSVTDMVAGEASLIDHPVGGTATENFSGNFRLALWAIVEADADADGYGDETQDLCPQSASYQTTCPLLKLARVLLPVGAKGLQLLIASEFSAPVKITASARIPRGDGRRARSIRFKSVTRTVVPGELARIKVNYPRSLLSALRSLPRRTKVRLTLKVTGTGIINTDVKTYRITLRGRR